MRRSGRKAEAATYNSFKYDPFGRRIYKSSSSGTSVYAFDGDNLIEETNSTGSVVARYEDTQNIDEPLAMLRSSATSYYHADGLGSVTSLSSSAGSIANTYTYDSYGKQTAATGSLVNPFRYTARESDTETGVYYYRARYYNPATRFLSEDPTRYGGGINFYAYVQNQAVNVADPSGLDNRCPSWVPNWLCNWYYGKPKPPEPDKFHPICTCTRRSANPIGKAKVCVYDCCLGWDFPLKGELVPLDPVKSKFPEQCKDLNECPYQILMRMDTSGRVFPNGTVPGDVVGVPKPRP